MKSKKPTAVLIVIIVLLLISVFAVTFLFFRSTGSSVSFTFELSSPVQETGRTSGQAAETEADMQSIITNAFYNTDIAKNAYEFGSASSVLLNYAFWQEILGVKNIAKREDVRIVNESVCTQDDLHLYCLQNYISFEKVHYAEFVFTEKDFDSQGLRFEAFIAASEYGAPYKYSAEEKNDIILNCSDIMHSFTESVSNNLYTMKKHVPEIFHTGKYGTYFYEVDSNGKLVVTLR